MNPVGKAGYNSPLGATVVDGGVNFSLFSRSATGVELLLFDREDDARPARVLWWCFSPADNQCQALGAFVPAGAAHLMWRGSKYIVSTVPCRIFY